MNRPIRLFNLSTLFLTLLVVLLSFPVIADEGKGKEGFAGHISVMTQNLYVGADLHKITETDVPVPFKVAEIFGDIQVTDFRQRAEAIADQIAKNRPHLIGLQEVSLLRTQCPDDIIFPPNDLTPNAEDVYADYLQILMDAMAARGLDYTVAAKIENVDAEMPVANLDLLDCPFPFFDVRVTDYDVTLRRSDVDVSLSIAANYAANLPVPTPAGPIVFTRGYNIVDADVHGRSYRFVNTHLEVNGNPFAHGFQFAQAYELALTLDGLAGTFGDKILIAVGDFNSDPFVGPVVDCMMPPAFDTAGLCPTPYTVMTANGYTDTWTLRNGTSDPGQTCCQMDLLMNTDSWLDQRYDHVWVRPPLSGSTGPNFLKAVHADTTGDRQKNRTPDGLWPSDHAGVVVDMTFRQEK